MKYSSFDIMRQLSEFVPGLPQGQEGEVTALPSSEPPSWDGRERRSEPRIYVKDGNPDWTRTLTTALLPDLPGFRRRLLLAVGGGIFLSLLTLQLDKNGFYSERVHNFFHEHILPEDHCLGPKDNPDLSSN